MAGKKQVFYSFHYDLDFSRVQQIRNIGQIEGNPPVSKNEWETVQRSGDAAIKRWIDDQLNGKGYLIVLIGKETSTRKWVKYEIERAIALNKKIIGIHVHNLKDLSGQTTAKGANPLAGFTKADGTPFNVYDPGLTINALGSYTYFKTIYNNLENWLENA